LVGSIAYSSCPIYLDLALSNTLFVNLKGSNLFMGYIGDSRAIMGSKDSNDSMVAVQLTVDLKPDLPSRSFAL
jgi:serine/threonine protein phosphatase PrpC